MTYACESCAFLFRRMGQIDRCPKCGGDRLRPADAEETKRLEYQLAEKCQSGGNA